MFRRERRAHAPTATARNDAPEPAAEPPAETPLPEFGETVELPDLSARATVGRVLGQGGQGTVYLASIEGSDQQIALKWYFPRSATGHQRAALVDLVERGAPHERFLWPLSLARPSRAELTGFGYAMPIRPPEQVGLVDLVTRRVDAPFRTLATIGLELSHGFLALHNEGLCYRDISFGNVFFDPVDGHVLICDNDNVGIDGASASAVRGTPYFIAPEVMRGEAHPSRNTDLWSLAVLLFYILMSHHPLDGRRGLAYDCWDEHAMQDMFGTNPAFIFDPEDSSNEAVPGEHDTPIVLWNLYPVAIRNLFVQAFTDGIHTPDARVRDGVWRSAMARLRDAVVYCQRCGKQNLYDETRPEARCWSCDRVVEIPPRLRIARAALVLNHDTTVYQHHLHTDYDFSNRVAEVSRHPDDESIWGLRNLSRTPWTATLPDGSIKVVEPDRSISLVDGLLIDFGPVVARIAV